MVYFLNSKVKIHAEDPLQYIFDENKEKIVVLGYSIVSRRSPLEVSGGSLTDAWLVLMIRLGPLGQFGSLRQGLVHLSTLEEHVPDVQLGGQVQDVSLQCGVLYDI